VEEAQTKFPPVGDQGQRNTCVSFSLTFLNEQLRDFSMDLSEEFLHWATIQRQGINTDGVDPNTACEAVVTTGQPVESAWPYDSTLDQRKSAYAPPQSAMSAMKYRADAFANPSVPTFHDMESFLLTNGPFALGVELWSPFLFPVDGFIHAPDPEKDQFLGLHLVCAVATAAHPKTHFSAILIRNSWGNRWGVEGYGYLSRGYIEKYTEGAWQLLGAKERV
jgi:hypothetical protein